MPLAINHLRVPMMIRMNRRMLDWDDCLNIGSVGVRDGSLCRVLDLFWNFLILGASPSRLVPPLVALGRLSVIMDIVRSVIEHIVVGIGFPSPLSRE